MLLFHRSGGVDGMHFGQRLTRAFQTGEVGEAAYADVLSQHAFFVSIYESLSWFWEQRSVFPPSTPHTFDDHMANLPPTSQRPRSFHPDFEREVMMVVFSVKAIISLSVHY
jgi:hypothetical protein